MLYPYKSNTVSPGTTYDFCSGLGRIKLADHITGPSLPPPVAPHAHHMGTTRMAADPKHGVVDENCKIFGVDNIYVAGSSIFSTGGAANPTLPIVQFSLRLADHVTGRKHAASRVREREIAS